MVSGSLSLPAQGCFSPVPHGTRSLSVTRESLALEGGPPSFTPRYSVSRRYSGTPLASVRWLGLPGCHRLWRRFPADFRCRLRYRPWVLQPRSHKEIGLGFGRFRSPLLPASQLIPLPPGTEMFQFPGFASRRSVMTGVTTGRVAPFGHPGISACVPLPLAYRSLPRPSSPPCAQASSTCYRSLDYKSGASRQNPGRVLSAFAAAS